jgi:hypothetical protein
MFNQESEDNINLNVEILLHRDTNIFSNSRERRRGAIILSPNNAKYLELTLPSFDLDKTIHNFREYVKMSSD